MKNTTLSSLILILSLVASCRTVEVGTGEVIRDNLCDWEIHCDILNTTCWAESWYQDATGKTRLALPITAKVAQTCYCQKHECKSVEYRYGQ